MAILRPVVITLSATRGRRRPQILSSNSGFNWSRMFIMAIVAMVIVYDSRADRGFSHVSRGGGVMGVVGVVGGH